MSGHINAPYWSFALRNPFKDPAVTCANIVNNRDGTTTLNDRDIQQFRNEMPGLLKSTITRIVVIALIYLAGGIIIPLIINFTLAKQSISNYKNLHIARKHNDLVVTKQKYLVFSHSHLPDNRNHSLSSSQPLITVPIIRSIFDNDIINKEDLTGIANFVSSTYLKSLQHGDALVAPPEPLNTLLLEKVNCDKLLAAIDAIDDPRLKLRTIDHLLYLRETLPTHSLAAKQAAHLHGAEFQAHSFGEEFIKELELRSHDTSSRLATNIYFLSLNQSIYANDSIGCASRNANGCCGSSALAFLAGSNDPIKDGYSMHKTYGLSSITTHADFDTDLIDKNTRVNFNPSNKIEELHNIAVTYITTDRYKSLLGAIPIGTKGILQVGHRFLAVKKHTDGRVEIFDSHGRYYPTKTNNTTQASRAYSATFVNSEDAALFLSANRRPAIAVSHLLLFSPITFPEDTTEKI